MIKKIKQWLFDRFLPMWAKETLLKENRALCREVEALKQKLEIQGAYLAGMENGVRALRRIVINNNSNSGRVSGENTDK